MPQKASGEAVGTSHSIGKEVTLIQCTNSKRDEQSPARDLYDESDYFCKMRAWAEARNVPWFILSAKHGLLHPDTVIEPYDERGLHNGQARDIARELSNGGVGLVYLCAGKDYTDPLIPVLERSGIDVVDNFAGMRIGERRKELHKRTAEIVNGSLC